MTAKLFSCVVLSLLMAACASNPDGRDEILAFEPDPSLPFESCISVGRIDRTKVLDQQNILFYMRGGQIYRNFLPRRCPGLDRREAFSYRSSASQLCAIDVITVLETSGFGPRQGASCGLGNFYPVSEIEVEALELEIERIKEFGLDGFQ